MDDLDALEKLDTLDELEDFEDESEEENDEKHKNLLNSLGVEKRADKSKKIRKNQRSEATSDVSIYSISAGSKVKARDLVKSLKETVNVNLIKKSLSKVDDSKNKLTALLPKITADKVERDASYEAATEKVSRWDDVVRKNRNAEHLSFPLKHENMQINTVDDFVQKFKPKTPLEQEIYALLKGNKYEEQPETGLSRAEEEALKSISIEEARRRRAELQKHRALLSYHEAKNRRLGKIKSRRHLRILRKQKEKKSVAEFEELERKDPEAAAEKLKLALKVRAEERAVLRHRQGSKWAKNRMLMAKYNEMTKVQLQDQKKLHSELVQKNLTKIESSDDDSDEEQDESQIKANALVAPTASLPAVYLPKDNPWLRQDGKSGKKMDENDNTQENDVEPDRPYTRSLGTILGLETVTQDKPDLSDDDSDEEEEMKSELLEIKKRKRMRKEIMDVPGGDEHEKETDTIQEESIQNFKAALENLRKEGRKMRQKPELETEEHVDDQDEENELEIGMERRTNLKQLDNLLKTEDDITTLSELHKTSQKKLDTKTETPKLQHIDPSTVFTLETQNLNSAEPTIVENEEIEPSRKEDSNKMTIREAFADDDVMTDFIVEKKKVVSDSKPKAVDLTLPGWGEWGGIGVKPSRRKRKKFFIKANPPPPRKDAHLGPVIINEKRDVKIAKHQVNQIPYPFASDEQYERSIRQPIGTTWNTPSTFKKLTQPKVTTVMGAMIRPMDEEDAFDNTKPQQRKRVMQNDGHIGFDDVTDTGEKKHFKRKRGNKKHKK